MNVFRISLLGVLVALLAFRPADPLEEKINYDEFFEEFFTYFNAHDWESMADMYAETAEFKDPALGFGVHNKTRAEFIQQYTELAEMIPDVQDSVVSIYPSGEHVTIEFISTGTAPDGQKFMLPICAILKIEGGLIVKDYVYYDNF